MAGSSLAVLEEKKNLVRGELDLARKVVTTPRAALGADRVVGRIPLLEHVRQLLRIDFSEVDLFQDHGLPAAKEVLLLTVKALLAFHRNVAVELDRLVQTKDSLERRRIQRFIGSRQEIESLLEAVEDRIEDLEIATSPEVHAALERLIDEAKAP
jgi:hypothetical protein